MTSEPFATGQCLCGGVRIVAKAKPVRMAQCHCRNCQRFTGRGTRQTRSSRRRKSK